MTTGAKDWTNSVTIFGDEGDGTLKAVRINADGRLEAVILGTLAGIEANITVDQEDSIREMQGEKLLGGLKTVSVDAAGRMLMVPIGETGNYLNVDAAGFMTAKISGALASITANVGVNQTAKDREMQGEKLLGGLKTVSVDAEGRMLMVPIGETGNYLNVDAAGFMTAKISG
ncbi:unnamed protein product, partial [marine sediment metagenome]